MVRMPQTVAVAGAGTMGAGIAELACRAGARTLLHDPDPEALARGLETVVAALDRGALRGRWSEDDAAAAAERLEPAASLDQLAPAGLVIEAAPESLALKQELLRRLSQVVAADCVLATNTSSLPVTAVAAGATGPERVVGMHFFNPAPRMPLLEVVAGVHSGERALAIARATGAAMGKHAIDAADGPGFLVNRVNRPFSLEAQRLLTERIADHAEIDRICRLGGGFPMGPFELMDLVGVDTGFDVARSFHEQSFGEPRWRPSPLVARMVAAGLTGRKAGRGFYAYGDGPHRPDDPAPPDELPGAEAAGLDDALVVIAGDTVLAHDLLDLAAAAGFDARTPAEAEGELPFLILDCGATDDDPPLQGGPQAILLHAGSLAALDPGGAAVGFHALPPLAPGTLVELTRGDGDAGSDTAAGAAERFFAALGCPVAWVGDAPGLVLGRIVCQLVNEASFAVGEGVGTLDDVDAGVLLGLNHPHGIFAWADEIGLDHVVAVLDALASEYGEERYRVAPLLRRLVLSDRLGRPTGEGFRLLDDEHDEDGHDHGVPA